MAAKNPYASPSTASDNPYLSKGLDYYGRNRKQIQENDWVKKRAETPTVVSTPKKPQQGGDFWGRLAQAGQNLIAGLTQPYKYVGQGVGEVAGEASGANEQMRQSQAKLDKVDLQAIKTAQQRLSDPKTPEDQKTRWRNLLKNLGQKDLPEEYKQTNDRTQQIIERTDPRRGAASVGSIGLDVLTAGVSGAATKAALRGTGKTFIKEVGKGAGTGAAAGTLSAAGEKDVDAGSLIRGAATGAAVGGAVTAAGRAVGGLIRRQKQPATKGESPSTTEVSIDRLTSYEGAPDKARVAFYKKQIEDGKPVEPLKVLEDSTGALGVEDGKHRLQALKELGFKTAPVETAGLPKSAALETGQAASETIAASKVPGTKGTPPGMNLSSRSNQFDRSLQDTIKSIEESPTYRAELEARGGDKVIGNKEVYQQARKLGSLTDDEIMAAKPLDKVDTVTLVRAKATLNQAAQEFTDMWKGGKTADDVLDQAAERLSKLEAGYKVMSAEPGRALQVQSSFVDTAYKLQQKLGDLQRTVKGATPDQKRAIIQEELNKYAGELESAGINKSTARKLSEMVAEYGTAAKLTSPLTHVINFSSNLLMLPQKALEDLVKIGLQVPRGHTGLGQAKYVFGTGRGLVNASKQFAADIKKVFTGQDVKEVVQSGYSKHEVKEAVPGKLGKIIRTPFRALTAADNFFKGILRDGELHQQAYSQAWREGFRGGGLKQRINELVAEPTEAMTKHAADKAKEFTFTSEPGKLTAGISKVLGDVPMLRLLIPFIQTPTNILKFQARRSPLGVFAPRNISDVMKGGVDRDEAIARLAVGTGMTTGTLMAAFNAGDRITGAAPTDPGERDAFYASGKRPYSVKVGDTWVAYNRFAPAGLYLTQAVGLRDALTNGDSKTAGNIFTSLVTTTAKGMADMPFVDGVSSVIDALENPDDMSALTKAVANPVTGLVPNISRDVATATDEVQRKPATLEDQLKMTVPGLRQEVPERLTTFGEPQRATTDPFTRGFVKIVSKEQPNKLFDALKEAGYTPGPPQKTQRDRKLNEEEYTRFQMRSGTLFAEKVKRATESRSYQELSPDRKLKVLSSAMSDARSQSLDEILGKKPRAKRERLPRF